MHSNHYFHCKAATSGASPSWKSADTHLADVAAKGKILIYEAKRGYDVAEDSAMGINPFYMKYAQDKEGNSNGRTGNGHVSFEKFVDPVTARDEKRVTLEELDKRGLPMIKNTIGTTEILEAGRRSMDENRMVEIVEKDGGSGLK